MYDQSPESDTEGQRQDGDYNAYVTWAKEQSDRLNVIRPSKIRNLPRSLQADVTVTENIGRSEPVSDYDYKTLL